MVRRTFILIVDVLLIALLIGGSLKVRRDWIAFTPTRHVAAIVPDVSAFSPLPLSLRSETGGIVDWREVASRNPFSPDRNDLDPIEVALGVVAPPRLAGPRPTLVGTIVVGKDATAMIASGLPESRSARPMKVGDTIDGWTIVNIRANAVAIETRGERQTLFMNDPATGAEREHERTPSATGPALSPHGSAPVLGQEGAASRPVVGPIVVEPTRVSGVQTR